MPTDEQYEVNPAMPVLLRPDGQVQVGWDPRRAVLVRPPTGMSQQALAELLRALQSPMAMHDVRAAAMRHGWRDPDTVADLVVSLIRSGVATAGSRRRPHTPSVRIHGRGPLSDLLASGLRCSGARVQRTSRRHAVMASEATDLMVLSDLLVTEPRVVRDLHATRIAHLPVRVRDGTGLVGPLVIPGVTSCLACADLHRSDRDAAWPAIAAQLRGAVGTADRATVLATAALALNQIAQVIRAVREGDDRADPPPTLDTTLEFDVGASSIVARRWSRHPRCSC